jgi:hypothetical protein
VKKILSTKSRNALLQLGLYQFVGGVIGVVACVLLVIRIGNVNGLVVLGGIIDFNLNLLGGPVRFKWSLLAAAQSIGLEVEHRMEDYFGKLFATKVCNRQYISSQYLWEHL